MVNKNALERYIRIDTCLSTADGADIQTLVEACGVSKQQVYKDLHEMQRLFPNIRIDVFTRKRKAIYRYTADSERINGTKLSDSEYGNIRDALKILESVRGLPYIKPAIEAIKKRLDESGRVQGESISFESSELLNNGDLVWTIYRHIREQTPLTFRYHTAFKYWYVYSIQPYYLKQYNGRWFLLAWEYRRDRIDDKGNLVESLDREDDSASGKFTQPRNYAIDRIDRSTLKVDRPRMTSGLLHLKCPIEPSQFFTEVIGATLITTNPVLDIVIKVPKLIPGTEWPNLDLDRIRTKKLHASQTEIEETDEFVRLQIRVRKNYELFTALMQYEHIEVESPDEIRSEMVKRLQRMASNYSDSKVAQK